MKTTKILLALVAALVFVSCEDNDDIKFPYVESNTVTFEGTYWNALVDNPQYYGPMLYGDGTYGWMDETTTLSSELTNDYGDGMFWGGGIAISNYIDANVTGADYNKQLAVPVSNGSATFAVVNSHAFMSFKDNTPRIVESIKIAPTTYLLNVEKNGNYGGAPLTGAADYFKVIATGYNGDVKGGTVDLYLTKNGVIQEGWETVLLAGLGYVTKIEFTFAGSDTGDWGLNTPAYFAFDDVVVKRFVRHEEQ